MPRLWDDTIDAHRRTVRDAILDAAASLVAAHGLRSVTMSQIAEQTGIGRATLYRYFPDVDAMLMAWHERQVRAHLGHLAGLARGPGDAGDRLEAVLEAYAFIQHAAAAHHAPALHRSEHVARAREHLLAFLGELVAEAAAAGQVRRDVAPVELAAYCLHALAAAAGLPSKAAVRRLLAVTLTGLRPGEQGAATG